MAVPIRFGSKIIVLPLASEFVPATGLDPPPDPPPSGETWLWEDNDTHIWEDGITAEF